MPFLPPNQQRQSTEDINLYICDQFYSYRLSLLLQQ